MADDKTKNESMLLGGNVPGAAPIRQDTTIDFYKLRQTFASNAVAQAKVKKAKLKTGDEIAQTKDRIIIEEDNVKLSFTPGLEKDFIIEARLLLDLFAMPDILANPDEPVPPEGDMPGVINGRTVTITINHILDIRGLTQADYTKASRRINRALRAIADMWVIYERSVYDSDGTSKKPVSAPLFSWIAGDVNKTNFLDDGVFQACFDFRFSSNVLGGSFAPFPKGFFRIDIKNHPDAYYIGRKIITQKHINIGNSRRDYGNTLSFRTLIDCVQSRRSIEELKAAGDRHIRRCAIDTLIEDLNEFSDKTGVTYYFRYKSKGGRVPDSVLSKAGYNDYLDYVVYFEWPNHPEELTADQKHQLELAPEEISRKVDELELIEKERNRRKAERRRKKKSGEGSRTEQ